MENPEQYHFICLLNSRYGPELKNEEFGDWTDRRLAKWLDSRDPLSQMRDQFHIPRMRTLPHVDPELMEKEEWVAYLCGNSVGLRPKCTDGHIQRELQQWAEMGVHAHFLGNEPWTLCDDRLLGKLAELVGANSTEEVALMNSTTINIHLLFAAFFHPNSERYKVLIEAKAFPTDHYAVESQLRMNNLDPALAMICMEPKEDGILLMAIFRFISIFGAKIFLSEMAAIKFPSKIGNGEECLRTEDILAFLEYEGHSISIIFFSGIQYYTGQLFDIERITKCGKSKGCLVGWDLSHAVANVPLRLHQWDVDFACWCNYKYACASPGGVAGMFIHERHITNQQELIKPGLLGWWGHRLETRFEMTNRMELAEGVAAYRLNSPSPLLMAAMRGFLDTIEQTSMDELRHKSLILTEYLEFLLRANSQRIGVKWTQITPREPSERGNQLSLKFVGPNCDIDRIYGELARRGIVVDKRCPNVIRVAPVPLYNKFDDVWRFVNAFCEAIQTNHDNNQDEAIQTNHDNS